MAAHPRLADVQSGPSGWLSSTSRQRKPSSSPRRSHAYCIVIVIAFAVSRHARPASVSASSTSSSKARITAAISTGERIVHRYLGTRGRSASETGFA